MPNAEVDQELISAKLKTQARRLFDFLLKLVVVQIVPTTFGRADLRWAGLNRCAKPIGIKMKKHITGTLPLAADAAAAFAVCSGGARDKIKALYGLALAKTFENNVTTARTLSRREPNPISGMLVRAEAGPHVWIAPPAASGTTSSRAPSVTGTLRAPTFSLYQEFLCAPVRPAHQPHASTHPQLPY